MNENPFLARIERQGELKGAHKFIIWALEDRFGAVPEELQQRIRRILDLDRLSELHLYAWRTDGLQVFAESIDPASTSTGD